jgi:DNA polymerase-3 subunit alpha
MTIDVAPRSFEDVIALMALIRPGPMEMAPDYIARKHGRTPITYMHPEMEPILAETYGVALYQEQVIRIANVLAGFSMAEGDGLRKAMGKKLPEEMAKYRDRFVQGGVAHGLAKGLAGDIFDTIERFAGYGFNKAHSAAYAVIAAQTAYLKANHPVEFMAALLSSEIGNSDKLVQNAVECRRAGIALLPPDVNRSQLEFDVEEIGAGEKAVRFGLAAVKNVGEGAVRAVLAARESAAQGQFASLDAFCDAVDWGTVNRRVAESLAKCGALDPFGPRKRTLADLEGAIGTAQKRQRASARGQIALFGEVAAVAPTPAPIAADHGEGMASDREVLAWEKELLGLYMSAHPLQEVLAHVAVGGNGPSQIVDLLERPPGGKLRVVAMVTSVRRIATKTNKTMAIVGLEDLTGVDRVGGVPRMLRAVRDALPRGRYPGDRSQARAAGRRAATRVRDRDLRLGVGPRRAGAPADGQPAAAFIG